MKILFIASECAPIAKVGGLADIIGSLPKTLKNLGIDVSIAIPFYGSIKRNNDLVLFKKDLRVDFDGKKQSFDLWLTHLDKVPVFLIKNDHYFSGEIYLEKDASSGGSEKEASRFLFLSVTAIRVAQILKTDILHCHDWHTGIIPYLNKAKRDNFKTILTIHNLQYQGVYGHWLVNKFLSTGFAKDVNCLETGILNADLITTVSPNYAKEILTPEFGSGLQRSLKKRKKSFIGILNGLDIEKFNPETDPFLPKNYSAENLYEKGGNKIFLQNKYFQNVNSEIPILGIISRLTEQKGINLIEKIIDKLMGKNLQFILLGQGMKEYEDFFKEKSRKFPQKLFAKIGLDEKLAQQIYAGADIFLMPSHFEPCGLGQQIAMRYGTVPVARSVGGIKDTVQNVRVQNEEIEGTGFLFEKYDSEQLLNATERALGAFQDKKIWRQIQINGMVQDFSWEKSAKIYVSLYEKLQN